MQCLHMLRCARNGVGGFSHPKRPRLDGNRKNTLDDISSTSNKAIVSSLVSVMLFSTVVLPSFLDFFLPFGASNVTKFCLQPSKPWSTTTALSNCQPLLSSKKLVKFFAEESSSSPFSALSMSMSHSFLSLYLPEPP